MYKGVYCKSLILVLQHNYTDLLGFSSGTHGAGFGSMLRAQIIKDAYEIIHSGSEQPEIFHLVGLFEENVGPDRLSDMVARIIYSDIVAYSKRIYRTLDISPETYPEYIFEDGTEYFPSANRFRWPHFTFSEIDRDSSSAMLDSSVIRNSPLLSMV